MTKEPSKPLILIVDDNPVNIKMLMGVLKDDYELSVATNGIDAIGNTKENPPDLILLDIMMPGMDGYEVCRRLKADRKTQDIPVIFITAMSKEEDRSKGLEIGAADYLTKPFSVPIVKAKLRTHLELKRLRDMLANLALLDGLTGIPNRQCFEEILDQMFKHSVRESRSISLIMIDIDFFKSFNEIYGRQAGDDCLKEVARVLHDSIMRPLDFVARYDGQEFACILPETDAKGASHVAEMMYRGVESLGIQHSNSTAADHVTISLGTATMVPTRNSSPSILIERADKAMYQAKKEGRNQVRSEDTL